MIELTLLYAALCWIVFKGLHLIRITTWTVLTAVLVGASGIGFIVVMMNFHQPHSPEARFIFYSTAIISEVNGRVTEVPVKAHQPLKKGDVLVKLDQEPFEQQLKTAEVSLDLAKRRVKYLQLELERLEKLLPSKAVSVEDVDTARDQRDEGLDQIRAAGAQMALAQHSLDHSVITAPTDGHVAQLMVRPGFMTVPLPFAPLMVFVHEEKEAFVAVFPQNVLTSIKPGDKVEVSLRAYPGHIFHAQVAQVANVIAEGQILANGQLQSFTAPQTPGRVPVLLQFKPGELEGMHLPGGAAGEATVYSGNFRLTEILRKLLFRMRSWENYLFAS